MVVTVVESLPHFVPVLDHVVVILVTVGIGLGQMAGSCLKGTPNIHCECIHVYQYFHFRTKLILGHKNFHDWW